MSSSKDIENTDLEAGSVKAKSKIGYSNPASLGLDPHDVIIEQDEEQEASPLFARRAASSHGSINQLANSNNPNLTKSSGIQEVRLAGVIVEEANQEKNLSQHESFENYDDQQDSGQRGSEDVKRT